MEIHGEAPLDDGGIVLPFCSMSNTASASKQVGLDGIQNDRLIGCTPPTSMSSSIQPA